MADLLTSLAQAAELAERIKRVLSKIKDSETREMVSDLTLKIANLKVDLGRSIDENEQLRRRLRELESANGAQCPSCQRFGWKISKSVPDPTFGTLGASRRTYLCSFCGFTESKIVH